MSVQINTTQDLFNIRNIFSPNKFNNKDTTLKTVRAHFLLAHPTLSASKMLSSMEKWLAENIELVNSADKQYGLTPLAISVMTQNKAATQRLIEMKANLKVQDKQGWTVLHFARVINNEEIIEVLKKASYIAGINLENSRNHNLGTPAQLDSLIRPKFSLPNERVYLFKATQDSKPLHETAEHFQKLTRAIFYNGIKLSPQALLKQWKQPSLNRFTFKVEFFVNEALKQAFLKFQQNPTQIALSPVPFTGFGVFAEEEIEEGQIIDVYGAQSLDNNIPSEYAAAEGYDALKIRNLAGMINDSFPNAILQAISNVNGVESLPVIVAIRKIMPKEQIFISYGADHTVSSDAHIELNPSELEAFVKTDSLKNLVAGCLSKQLNTLKQNQVGFLEHISILGFTSKVLYLFSRPTALGRLILNNKIKASDILDVLANPMSMLTMGIAQDKIQMLKSTVHFLQEILHKLKTKSPLLTEAIKKYALSMIEHLPIAFANSNLKYINDTLVKINLLADWQLIQRDCEIVDRLFQLTYDFMVLGMKGEPQGDYSLIRQANEAIPADRRNMINYMILGTAHNIHKPTFKKLKGLLNEPLVKQLLESSELREKTRPSTTLQLASVNENSALIDYLKGNIENV